MTANRSDLAELLWRHTQACVKRACASERAWHDADQKVARYSAAIAEHIVREEEDVGEG